MLYDAGASEVHVRISCPQIKFPDFYGVDIPTKEELLANNKNKNQMCEYIGAKTLEFLSLKGLYRAEIKVRGTLHIPNLAIIIS